MNRIVPVSNKCLLPAQRLSATQEISLKSGCNFEIDGRGRGCKIRELGNLRFSGSTIQTLTSSVKSKTVTGIHPQRVNYPISRFLQAVLYNESWYTVCAVFSNLTVTTYGSNQFRQRVSLSFRFNGHFSRWTCDSQYQNVSTLDLLELRMTEVVVTTGAITRATLQSNRHHQFQTPTEGVYADAKYFKLVCGS